MKKYRLVAFFVTAVVFFSSCVPLGQVAYLQSDRRSFEMVYEGPVVDNAIRPGDEIYVRISGADEGPTSLSTDMRLSFQDASLMSYTVSEEGFLKLPYVGNVYVANLTLDQAVDVVEEALKQFLFFPSVYIRFINTKITVLGEVKNPGVFSFNYKSINIMQAIGYAGDMTEFANRKKVMLIREDGGTRSKYFLDLTSDEMLRSDFYLVKSDDIIYVEPLRRKKWDMAKVPYNLIFSAITTVIVVYTFINTNTN